ncbi:MAG: hypothetical protein E5X72_00015 [Mesorhizobium sp.]|uniref:hypothetical protein n=1 Tax=Mesorhizobium sp. TaxID=1871066 RepID=UPI00120BBEF1|nr:hypothetical protein [Mesorhizobium sp.]TIP06635.1 MAG: hypothetical protein E5X72_00015 [Mesorhizobium sp.]
MSADASKSDNAVDRAATWLATGGADRTKATVPQVRERFGLSALQAVQAIRESHLIKARSH